jgi:DNA-binding MarR family transcriptional regulator
MVKEPNSVLLYVLKRAYFACRGYADEMLAPYGISLTQFGVLGTLDGEPGLSGAELARRCFVSAPTMNGLLTPLEEAGLIVREPDPQGGRRVLARLSPKGEKLVASCLGTLDHLEEDLVADLAVHGDDFIALLRSVAERAERRGTRAEDGRLVATSNRSG